MEKSKSNNEMIDSIVFVSMFVIGVFSLVFSVVVIRINDFTSLLFAGAFLAIGIGLLVCTLIFSWKWK